MKIPNIIKKTVSLASITLLSVFLSVPATAQTEVEKIISAQQPTTQPAVEQAFIAPLVVPVLKWAAAAALVAWPLSALRSQERHNEKLQDSAQ